MMSYAASSVTEPKRDRKAFLLQELMHIGYFYIGNKIPEIKQTKVRMGLQHERKTEREKIRKANSAIATATNQNA